jgi:tetratricopeptide (TPR) repeat protein
MRELQRLIILCSLAGTVVSCTWFFGGTIAVAASAAACAQPQASETDQLVQEAYSLLQQRRFDEALAKSLKAAALSPKDFRPHAMAAYAYFGQNKLKSASQEFGEAIRLQPQRKELYMAKAQADHFRNAHEEALQTYRNVIKIDPNYAEAYAKIGSILRFDEKRRDEAIAALETAIRLNPKLLSAYDDLGDLFAYAKDDKRAEETFRKGMAADPQHMAGRFHLGRMMVKQGRLAEARELWEGRTFDEDRTMPHFIDVLTRAENLKRAKDALAKKPKDPDALIEMGFAVMEGDSWVVDRRQERAIVYFRQALELKPDSARAQYGIVKALIQIADTFTAEKPQFDREMAKLRQLDPKLAEELEEYRKNYVGGLRVKTLDKDQ